MGMGNKMPNAHSALQIFPKSLPVGIKFKSYEASLNQARYESL